MTTQRQTLFIIFVLLSLLSNSAWLPWLTANKVQQASLYSSETKELICTGREMRWIDPAASSLAGHFVFVEPPTESPTSLHNTVCHLGVWADHQATLFSLHSLPVSQQPDEVAVTEQSSADLNATFSKALSRAPPFFPLV